jgi:hypothetical protein
MIKNADLRVPVIDDEDSIRRMLRVCFVTL